MTEDATGPDEGESHADESRDSDAAPDGGPSDDGRTHPWAPYDRDDPSHAEEFDAPTRDARPGVDYDVTQRSEDPARLREEIEELRDRLEAFESDVERRTVPRDELEGDLRRYVRRRLWRGHARGWGPYLVFLYGTVMTLGAFYWLQGITAIAAMIILWLSTLGLYVFMMVVGIGLEVLQLPWKFRDRIGEWRSS
jgi:hypothetical protein